MGNSDSDRVETVERVDDADPVAASGGGGS